MQDFSPQVIFGLGNVGARYQRTRHNAGFLFLDFLHDLYKDSYSDWAEEKKWHGFVSQPITGSSLPTLVKPTTLMNSSGLSVQSYTHYFQIPRETILIVHDDLDLNLGSFKLQFAKGPKVHNGLASIDQQLGSPDYARLRIGIDNRAVQGNSGIPGMKYTLDNFSQEELRLLQETFTTIQSTLNWLPKE